MCVFLLLPIIIAVGVDGGELRNDAWLDMNVNRRSQIIQGLGAVLVPVGLVG